MILMNVEQAPRVWPNAAKEPIDMSFQFNTDKPSEMSRYATRNSPKHAAMPREPLSRISVSLPEALLMALDRLVARRGFPSRSHAIALVLGQLIAEHKGAVREEASIGTITILHNDLYDVHRELARVRQRCSAEIISCLNSQVASGQTLEVMLIHGSGRKLNAIRDEVGRLRGVVFAKLQLVGPSSSRLNSDLSPPVEGLTHIGLGRALSLS
jgi:CopG family transcriptional regulator, nickel-responsive regulator